MKALLREKYGSPDVLYFGDVEKPVPENNEVLIKIKAVSLNSLDHRILVAKPAMIRLMGMGFLKPKNRILGDDISGVIESVGENVTRFKSGDEVFGLLSAEKLGGLAEYAVADENFITLKSPKMTFEEASALPVAGLTAFQAIRDKCRLQPGQRMLINGASGGVGTFAVLIAKAFGAEVTAVCSTGKAEMVRSLGADRIIDYKKEDLSQLDETFDTILGVNGFYPLSVYKRLLKPQGIYVMVGGESGQIFQAMLLGKLMTKKGGKTFTSHTAKSDYRHLGELVKLFESGKVRPVIDKVYPFTESIDAFRYLCDGHVKGKLVIAMDEM